MLLLKSVRNSSRYAQVGLAASAPFMWLTACFWLKCRAQLLRRDDEHANHIFNDVSFETPTRRHGFL